MAVNLPLNSGNHVLGNVTFALTILALVLIATRVFTECRFWLQSRGSGSRFQGREPLTLPYIFPWIGNAFRMFGPHALYYYAQNMSPEGRPVIMRIGPVSIYMIFGIRNMNTFFKAKKLFKKDNLTFDKSGLGLKPRTDVPQEKRLWKNTHDIGVTLLGHDKAINALTSEFIEKFTRELDGIVIDPNTAVPLHDFFKEFMFTASSEALLNWDEFYGSKYTRVTVKTLADGGISRDGQAATMLPVIWAFRVYFSVCATEFSVQQSPTTLESSASMSPSYSPTALSSHPCTSNVSEHAAPPHIPKLLDDFDFDGYVLKKGGQIMCSSWPPNFDAIWDVPSHPATPFWPERHIEMPKMKPSNPDDKSQYETAMKQENFFPYGGGGMICTGRFFAKQEIMAAVAIFLLKLDIEPQGWATHKGKKSGQAARPDEGYVGAGILPRDRDMPVKLKRRN
ncbi:hypothetical protein G7Y89_g3177 [Cudoniella acicularis]|uniref:Cytochrome P450 n=1 Tax=Cudoniella acicularis TaxID=354080 RepID=A0A8H4W5U0_9HELO|nr:hypothetical protein G7Y89_g3177 [Cudoniella acicularis]